MTGLMHFKKYFVHLIVKIILGTLLRTARLLDLTTLILYISYSIQLEIEKCGCNSKCFYQPDIVITKQTSESMEKLPCKFYYTVAHTQNILAIIRRKRTKLH